MIKNLKELEYEFELPSNKTFGLLFFVIFNVISYFLYINKSEILSLAFLTLSITFLLLVIFSPDNLMPLNKVWIRFGLIIGMIINPLILGLIFFGLFTPIAILMRLFARDYLVLNFQERPSYWIVKNQDTSQTDSFKQQF